MTRTYDITCAVAIAAAGISDLVFDNTVLAAIFAGIALASAVTVTFKRRGSA